MSANSFSDFLDEVEAELEAGQPAQTISEEEQRYRAKQEAVELANSLTLYSPQSGLPRVGALPDALPPDASGKDIAARIALR